MKPFILLLVAFGVAAFLCRTTAAGNIAMCAMLCFTALGHFKFTQGMAKMVPTRIPFKKEIVLATGVLEILFGVGLLFPGTRLLTGVSLVIFLVIMLPANIHAARNHLNYETGEFDGKGLRYLWFRVPLQLFFIGWVVYFSVL